MKTRLLRRSAVLILIMSPVFTLAQSSCESLISDAEQAFDAGRYDSVITNLEKGLKECNFSKLEKQRAYELLIKTQIEKDNPEERDKALVRLLRLNPNYKPTNPQSGNSFNLAFQKYTVNPFISLGICGGFNASIPHIQTVYSILNGADYAKEYTPIATFQTNAHLEVEFFKYLSLCFEPGDYSVSYSRTISGENDWNLLYTETQSNTSLNGFIKVGYPLKKFKIFAEAGYDYSIIKKSIADVELHYVAYNSITQQNDAYQIAANKIDLMSDNLRVKNLNSYVFGLGGSYRTNNIVLFVDMKYLYSKDNLVRPEYRYANKLLTFDYYYIDNDFDMDRFQFQVGISYVFYYLVKKKK